MSNPITGDFEAVLQVSGGTVNRLLASMHQNDGMKPDLPTMPHFAVLRIGDERPIEGMRGKVWAQIGAPSIELVDNATDRFWLEAGFRARYKADAGTKPLPEFIHGTVRAQYRFDSIDPGCYGWGAKADEFVWVRVVDDSVAFRGTAVDDALLLSAVIAAVDEAEVHARITRLITILLRTRFEATPHRVSKRFRRGVMISLQFGMDRSAVALPVGLSADPAAGRLDSIDQDLLEGRDFGIAISREYILSKVQPVLDEIRAGYNRVISYYSKTNLDVGLFDVDVLTIDIKWRVTLTSATVQWSGGAIPLLGISAGVLTLKVAGQALTANSAYNITFDATQLVTLTFDPSTERFVAAVAGAPVVHVQPVAYEGYAKSRIEQQIKPEVQAAVGQLVDELDLSARKIELINQLRTLDDLADARFDEAVFGPDGVIVRGGIGLTPRRRAATAFDLSGEKDSFTAFQSWIPGGTIDRFEWTWSSFNKSGPSGSRAEEDRFLLRRPPASSHGTFGVAVGLRTPLPGLDGSGTVCLTIRGTQVDPHTGGLIPLSGIRTCHRYGVYIQAITPGPGRLFLRESSPQPGDPSGPVQETALVEVGSARGSAPASNTLVLYAGERWNAETAATLRDGLRACRRSDAGLLVVVLFRDGALAAGGQDLRVELDRLAETLEAPLLANEDVEGRWSAALALRSADGRPAWRLIGPGGGVTWMHGGQLPAEMFGSALENYLLPSPPPRAVSIQPRVAAGMRLAASALHPGYADLAALLERPCPAPPPGRSGMLESIVVFVQPKSASSRAQMREIGARAAERGAEPPAIIVVVDGADAAEAEALRSEIGQNFTTLPDPGGTIASRFGVRIWPTTVRVNRVGVVSEVEIGHGARKLEGPERERDRDVRTSK